MRFDARGPAEDFVRQIRVRSDAAAAAAAAWPWRRWLFPGVTAAAVTTAALALLVLGPRLRHEGGADPDDDRERPITDVRAKGAPAVSIILLRDGTQTRQLGAVTGHLGDRFRIEIALAAATELGVTMVDDKQNRMTSVVTSRRFEAGTHLLEPAFAFDDEPGTTRLLVGKPAEVERAAATGRPSGAVTVVRLISAGGRSSGGRDGGRAGAGRP